MPFSVTIHRPLAVSMTRSGPRAREHRVKRTPTPELESTRDLLALARAGDESAIGRLYDRYLPALKRWAHGRLPAWAREMRDTEDLVQDSVLQTLRQVTRFEPVRDGAFFAFLRKVLHNRLIDEIRRVNPARRELLKSDHPLDAPSPVEEVIGQQALSRYEGALERLTADEREGVVARVELGCSYAEIADALGKPSPDAARMVVSRALLRLAKEMKRGR